MAKLYLIIFFFFICLNIFPKEAINIYSARQEVLMRPLIKIFEKNSNIKVNIIAAKANQLISRIEQEGDYTKADILLTTDVGRLYNAKEKNILQKINNIKLNNNIPTQYRDKENFWFGFSLRARIFVYNKQNVDPLNLKGYIDLANSNWLGKVLVRSSNNVYNQSLVSAMIINYGDKKVGAFLENFTKNFARKPSGGDRDQIRAVVAGQGDIALVNSYYFLKMKSQDKENLLTNISEYFPKDNYMKTHVNISGAGIIKNSKNKKNAIKFLEFLSSDVAQKIYAEVNYEYPIRKNIELNNYMSKYNNFTKDKTDLTSLARLNKKSIMLMDIAGWR